MMHFPNDHNINFKITKYDLDKLNLKEQLNTLRSLLSTQIIWEGENLIGFKMFNCFVFVAKDGSELSPQMSIESRAELDIFANRLTEKQMIELGSPTVAYHLYQMFVYMPAQHEKLISPAYIVFVLGKQTIWTRVKYLFNLFVYWLDKNKS